jgi:hypothetical protein
MNENNDVLDNETTKFVIKCNSTKKECDVLFRIEDKTENPVIPAILQTDPYLRGYLDILKQNLYSFIKTGGNDNAEIIETIDKMIKDKDLRENVDNDTYNKCIDALKMLNTLLIMHKQSKNLVVIEETEGGKTKRRYRKTKRMRKPKSKKSKSRKKKQNKK